MSSFTVHSLQANVKSYEWNQLLRMVHVSTRIGLCTHVSAKIYKNGRSRKWGRRKKGEVENLMQEKYQSSWTCYPRSYGSKLYSGTNWIWSLLQADHCLMRKARLQERTIYTADLLNATTIMADLLIIWTKYIDYRYCIRAFDMWELM